MQNLSLAFAALRSFIWLKFVIHMCARRVYTRAQLPCRASATSSSKDSPTVPKGATAFGVRLLDKFVADNYEG